MVVLQMLVRHASNLSLHQLIEELVTEGGVHFTGTMREGVRRKLRWCGS